MIGAALGTAAYQLGGFVDVGLVTAAIVTGILAERSNNRR